MKTTFTVIIATLIFLGTPLLAAAHDSGTQRSRQQQTTHEWVQQKDNHGYQLQGNNWHHRQPVRHQVKQGLRQTRHEVRYVKQAVRRYDPPRRPYYVYNPPPVVIGLPHVVFSFGW